VDVLTSETGIRVSGYQEVDIRKSEYQDEQRALTWYPDFPVSCTLISWSPDTRPNPLIQAIGQLANLKALKGYCFDAKYLDFKRRIH
jgi:hypothetical protein